MADEENSTENSGVWGSFVNAVVGGASNFFNYKLQLEQVRNQPQTQTVIVPASQSDDSEDDFMNKVKIVGVAVAAIGVLFGGFALVRGSGK